MEKENELRKVAGELANYTKEELQELATFLKREFGVRIELLVDTAGDPVPPDPTKPGH